MLGSDKVSVFVLDSGIDYLNIDLNGLVDLTRSTDRLGTFLVPTSLAGGGYPRQFQIGARLGF